MKLQGFAAGIALEMCRTVAVFSARMSGNHLPHPRRTNRPASLQKPYSCQALTLPMNTRISLAIALCSFAVFRSFAEDSLTNRVLRLDGKTGCMVVADSPSLHSLSNAITLEVRFQASSFYQRNGAVNTLLRKNATANGENFFLRFRIMDGKPAVEMSPGNEIGVLRAQFDFKPGKWYHLAGTYDGSTARVFVDGVAIHSEALSGAMQIDQSELLIGRGEPSYSSGEYFDGALDNIRIWNVARSAGEIQAAMNTPLTGNEPGLVACWNFNGGTLEDKSGHGNGGVLNGQARIVESAELASTSPAPLPNPPEEKLESTVEKRLETLEDLWRHLSDTYPALEYKGITGHAWIEPTAERVRQAKSDEEFYGLLLELMASLKDTHTRIVSYPGQPRLEAPPVLLNRVEGKVAVLRADPGTGLSPGDVLVAVEGRAVEERLDAETKQVCNSTERGRVREACGRLLRGKPGSTVTATFQSPDKGVRQVTLHRGGKAAFWAEPAISSRRLGESLGYIRISRWGGEDLVAEFDRALEEFKACAGLIIDVRGNGGGDDHLADLVNGRLTDRPVVSSIDFWRETGSDQYKRTIGWVQPRGPWTYRGRVAVLIDEGCASACEHFVSGIEAIARVLLVGMPTNGAGGGPTLVTLRDGTKVVISRALGLRVNGVVFEGHGLPPHIYASPSLSDLRQGRDAALDLAKEWLLSAKPLPKRDQPLP